MAVPICFTQSTKGAARFTEAGANHRRLWLDGLAHHSYAKACQVIAWVFAARGLFGALGEPIFQRQSAHRFVERSHAKSLRGGAAGQLGKPGQARFPKWLGSSHFRHSRESGNPDRLGNSLVTVT